MKKFELRDEVNLFLKDEKASQFINYLHDPTWLVHLAYLADIFDFLNELNLQLRGNNATIFNVQDKIKTLTLKLELWRKSLENKDLESLTTLQEYVTATGIKFPEKIVQDFKKYMS